MPRTRRAVLHLLIVVVVLAVVVVAARRQTDDPAPEDQTFNAMPLPFETPLAAGQQETAPATLARAQQLISYGEVERAMVMLQAVIDDAAVERDVASEARLTQGKAYLELGEPRRAVDTLSALREDFPESEQATLAQFFIGQAERARGREKQAITAFREYSEQHPLTEPYLRLIIAEILLDEDDASAARDEAEWVAAADVIPRTSVDALEHIQAIQQHEDDHSGVLQTTTRLLELATIPNYRAELWLEMGATHLALEDQEAAIAAYLNVLQEAPESSFAGQALAALDELDQGQRVTDELRGQILYFTGDYAAAIEVLSRALNADPESDTAWYYRALSRLQTGELLMASGELTELVRRYPESQFAPAALYRAGVLFEDRERPREAGTAYQNLINDYAASTEAVDARFRLGFLAYLDGDYQTAADLWDSQPNGIDGAARNHFWAGKAYAQLGREGRARNAWNSAVEDDPYGFYGQRAGELLSGRLEARMATEPLDTSSTAPAMAELQAELEEWYRAYGSDATTSLAQAMGDESFRRSHELQVLGLQQYADWEIDTLVDRFDGNPAALASLARALAETGDVTGAHRVSLSLRQASLTDGNTLPVLLQRLTYPLPYAELVQYYAGRQQIDPLLVMALIRQESSFDPKAHSWADARGLAQVIPSTGAAIANGLGRDNWDPDDLFRPTVSIEFGALYLAERLAVYDGHVFPALAGYNAGDGNAGPWLDRFSLADPDLYAERIPFPETHEYVQLVYANYLNYQRLYR